MNRWPGVEYLKKIKDPLILFRHILLVGAWAKRLQIRIPNHCGKPKWNAESYSESSADSSIT
jgi:hypothetical protein